MGVNNFINKRKLFKNFIVKAIVCYILWQLLFIGLIRPHTNIENIMVDGGVAGSVIGLNLLGFNSHAVDNIVYIDKAAAVRVEKECSGLELIALYIGFLICFPGSIKPKIVYAFIGSIILYFINILRDIVLALNSSFFRSSFEVNHKYTYTIIVYIIVFLIWKHWVKNYSLVSRV